MQRRTENPNERSYKYYGARGVRVSEVWRHHPEAFVQWAIAQGWTHENRLCVARRGDVGDYSPGNCYLTTRSANSMEASVRYWGRKHKLEHAALHRLHSLQPL